MSRLGRCSVLWNENRSPGLNEPNNIGISRNKNLVPKAGTPTYQGFITRSPPIHTLREGVGFAARAEV